MPLRDHFHPPFADRRSWDEVHGYWPAAIVRQLNVILPARYYAGPLVHLGSLAEVDIATHDYEAAASTTAQADNGGMATAVWAPPQPTLALETELAGFDSYEVRVYDERHGRRLVAVIELVSPSNKDRPQTRAEFATKCVSLLRQRVSVIVVDVVTQHEFNLYAELLDLIGEEDPSLAESPKSIYAVACRWVPNGANHRLETWNQPLTISDPLPVLPLWLTEELAISLDLEASYEQTCRDLRIV